MRYPSLPRFVTGILCLLLPSAVFSQGSSSFCSNTALVPVFKQDFGQSPNATSSTTAPPGSTNYRFGNVGTDGNYIVTSRVENANKSDWTRGRDHTGNTNGNFFLVNAGGNRNIFLQQTVTGLCPGSSYSFTAWLANVNTPLTNSICGNNPVYPRITFNIRNLNDSLLATYTTQNLPLSPNAGPVNWQKYGFQFSLPSNTTSLKIQMVDFWGGGPACGNDVALDDILFEACVPQITVSLLGGNDVCTGQSLQMQSSLVNSPYTTPAYLWQKSNNNGSTWDSLGTAGTGFNQLPINNAQPQDGGLYRVLVAPTPTNILNPSCGAISNVVRLTVNPLPQLQVSSNGPLCSGNGLVLTAQASGGSGQYDRYRWTGPQAFSDTNRQAQRTNAQTAFTGRYTAVVTDSKGCSDSAALDVRVDSTPVLSWLALNDSICSGAPFQARVAASLPNVQVTWSNNNPHALQINGQMGTSNSLQFNGSARHNQNNSLPFQLQAQARSAAGCSSRRIDSTLIVHAVPGAAVAGADQILCASPAQLQAQTPLTGTGKWNWLAPTDSSIYRGLAWAQQAPVWTNNLAAQTSVQLPQAGRYAMEWSVSTPYCGTRADTVLLSLLPPPNPLLAVADSVWCGPADVVFQNKTPNAQRYGFRWRFNNGSAAQVFAAGTLVNGTNGVAQQITARFRPSTSGLDTSYTIVLQAFTACDTLTTTQTIVVKQKPTARLQARALNTCYPLEVEWQNVSPAASGASYQWVWQEKDSVLDRGQSLRAIVPQASSPLPFLTATNGCGTDTARASVAGTTNPLNIRNNLRDTAVCALPFRLSWQDASTGFTQSRLQWSDGSSSAAAGTNNSRLFQAVGRFQLTQTFSNACGDSSISRTIVVRSPVKSLWTATPAAACVGESFLFKSQAESGLGLRWLINDSLAGNMDTLRWAGQSPGQYRVQLLVAQTYPEITCADTSSQNIVLTATAKGKMPVLPASLNCLPQTLALVSDQPPGTVVSWRINDSLLPSAPTPQWLIEKKGIYRIGWQALQPNGCTYTDSSTLVAMTPTGKVVYQGGVYCQNKGTTVNFQAETDGSTGLEVDFGDGTKTVVQGKTFSHTYAQVGKYQPRFVVLGEAGCNLALPLGAPIEITAVQVQFNITHQYNCGLTQFQFNPTLSTNTPIQSWEWSSGGVVFAQTEKAQKNFDQPGLRDILLVVQTPSGCRDSVQAILPVTVYAFPKVSIQSLNETCLKSQMELRADILSADSVIRKQWLLGNSNPVNDTSIRVVFVDQGKAVVRFLAATVNQCYDSARKEISIHPLPIVQLTPQQKVCWGDSLTLKADGAVRYTWKDQQENILCDNCPSFKVKPLRNTAYLVVGKNEYGCVQSAQTQVRVIEKFSIRASTTDSICVGATTELRAGGAAAYQWLPQAGLLQAQGNWATVRPLQTTTYRVVGRDADQCFTDTANIKVIVGQPTPLQLGKDTVVLAGSKLVLKANTPPTPALRYRWSGGADLSCVSCPEPVATFSKDQCVTCTITNGYGCVSKDTLCIKTLCPTTEVFVANAFTPDGDGTNDKLFVQGAGISMVRYFRIFNRWGEMVFESRNHLPNDATKGWDGRVRGQAAAPEVYVWMAEVQCEKGAVQFYKGNSAIIK